MIEPLSIRPNEPRQRRVCNPPLLFEDSFSAEERQPRPCSVDALRRHLEQIFREHNHVSVLAGFDGAEVALAMLRPRPINGVGSDGCFQRDALVRDPAAGGLAFARLTRDRVLDSVKWVERDHRPIAAEGQSGFAAGHQPPREGAL